MSKPLFPVEDTAQPNHIGIIMDGNRRWARARGISLARGYRQGLAALRHTVRAAHAQAIPCLTVYAFSNANWERPPQQIKLLMDLVKTYIRGDLAELHRNGVRLNVVGKKEGLASDITHLVEEAIELTSANRRMTLTLAFNYGGRDEIIRAAQAYAETLAAGQGRPLDETHFTSFLDTGDLPPLDLLIRTGGEKRLSDFLLWQSAYAELVFLDRLWPDFTADDLTAALMEYSRRERRFGGGDSAGDNKVQAGHASKHAKG